VAQPALTQKLSMLIDETRVTDGIIETDICVIGAGPAGITFAREFIGLPIRVSLLESGRFGYDEQIQKLSEGKLASYYYNRDAIVQGRRRQFGGTTNRWSYTTDPGDRRVYARCLPPESIDLTPCADQPSLCWPLSLDELHPFFRRAQFVWNGGVFDYDVSTWANALARPIDASGALLTTRICQHGPADVFSLRYRDDILSAANIDVYLTCTGLALESDGTTGRARSLRVARGDGKTFSIAAKAYVLAGGGVENVQLLLLSEMTQPGAVGNRHDNVGRYVTDHPEFRMGSIVPGRFEVFDEITLYDIRWVGRHMVSGFLTIAHEVKRSEKLLNMSVALVPRGAGFGTEAHRAMESLSSAIRLGEMPTHLCANIRSILSSPQDVAAVLRRDAWHYAEWRGGWSRQDAGRQQFKAIELWAAPEQTAERNNNFTLTDERDWLGRKRVNLDWRWSQSDRDNVERSVGIFSSQIEAAGLGSFKRWIEFQGPARPRQSGLHHPMGGTRMHVDPRLGVVDDNCLVHGLANVYVAGSSVFPTGLGYANPTLTILALTLRLADQIKADLGLLRGGASRRKPQPREPTRSSEPSRAPPIRGT
jgi:choline dehydrogenase-like flavoprotein